MPLNNLEKLASIDAQLRLLVPGKVSEDDKLIEYDALLLDRFLDILQDLHGDDLKETVQECYELSAEYEGKHDSRKLEELGSVLTSLDPGDSIVVASSFSHMLNLANLAEEVQIAYRRRIKLKKGDFADENSATTESDIEETFKRLVGQLNKSPEEVFDALKNQTVDLVFTAHPTQSIRRSLLQKHARIRNCLTQLYAKVGNLVSSLSLAMETTVLQNSGKPSQKVVGIAAGEAHTLALTADGSIYSWGRGTLGRLGTGKANDDLLPVRVGFDLECEEKSFEENCEGEGLKKIHKFVGIAAGAYHSLALEDDGSVWSWGYNIYGQLGLDREDSFVPCLLEGFVELGSPDSSTDEPNSKNKVPLKVCSLRAGGMMSLAIDSLGGLWMWGNCPQMGSIRNEESFLVSSHTPLPVWDLHGHSVVKVACGNEHVVALVSAGETYNGGDLICYSWGNNNHGQLGLGDKKSRNSPEVVETFNCSSTWTIYEIACGAFHTAVLTHKKAHGDTQAPSSELEYENRVSVCWTFGLGDNGQLGHGTTNSLSTPEPINGLPANALLKSIDCGLFHTSVVSEDGDVWSWGMERGLGLCPNASFTGNDSGDALSPRRISSGDQDGSKFAGPVQVACGAAHTVFVGHDGFRLWTWGRGRSGVLGRGNEVDSLTPCIVMWPPLDEDFKKEEGLDMVSMEEKSGGTVEMEKKNPLLIEEMEHLRSNLTFMERYANMLHFSIFGEPLNKQDLPVTLQNSDLFDIQKEWENMMELASHAKLTRMEAFYQTMLTRVKDKLMKRQVQEIIKEYLNLSTGIARHQ